MIVIGKGSMIRPDALTPHIIDDEMRVVGEFKAEGFVKSAYRRSEGPGFYLLAEGPSVDAFSVDDVDGGGDHVVSRDLAWSAARGFLTVAMRTT